MKEKNKHTNSKPETQNPEPRTRNPELKTQNPELKTQNPEPRTQNPEPKTQNPELKTPNPKPRIQNPEPRTQNPEPGTSRRGFLKKVWGVLGVVAGVEILAVSAGFFSPSKKILSNASQHIVETGNVGDFKLNSVSPFRSGKFYLVRLSDGGFLAVSLKCTHLGCSVLWNEEKQEFICPCHASSFDKNGVVMNPPAPRPLDIFPVIVEEGIVKVDTGNPQRRKSFIKNQIVYA